MTLELVWGNEVRDKINQSCLYITGNKMSGLLRPMYRKEPGLTLDSRKCEAANPRLGGLTKFPTDQASDTDPYRCNGSERGLSQQGQPTTYNLQVEINVNCHLFTGVLSAN